MGAARFADFNRRDSGDYGYWGAPLENWLKGEFPLRAGHKKMFVDQVTVEVRAGKGGDGAVASVTKNSFRSVAHPVVMVAVGGALFSMLTPD